MNVIDDLKKLLATATAQCVCTDYRCEHRAAAMELGCVITFPLAKALVKSQEALEKVAQVECDDLIHFSLIDDPESCDPDCIRCPVEAALRMDSLKEAMK